MTFVYKIPSYEAWYGKKAAPLEIIQQSVYGLTEWNAENVQHASLIANPGCYSTAVLLSLLTFAKRKID
ncbi:hypothetical protein ABNX05_07570 [Lysinibacillus sp. M3]|uniref:Uncharacterized protein n=1 Tax=Lysinibacillus zambalensis TaxID=3160866 RepID=A0ABV1MTA2_9BACI